MDTCTIINLDSVISRVEKKRHAVGSSAPTTRASSGASVDVDGIARSATPKPTGDVPVNSDAITGIQGGCIIA